VASTVINPESDMAWWLVGDELGLLKVSATSDVPDAINENVTDGMIIHYEGEPEERTEPEEYPDIDNVFHAPLVEVVLAKLYSNEAKDSVRRGNIEAAQMNRALGKDHQKIYDEKVKRLGVKKTDKTGGMRAIRPLSFR